MAQRGHQISAPNCPHMFAALITGYLGNLWGYLGEEGIYLLRFNFTEQCTLHFRVNESLSQSWLPNQSIRMDSYWGKLMIAQQFKSQEKPQKELMRNYSNRDSTHPTGLEFRSLAVWEADDCRHKTSWGCSYPSVQYFCDVRGIFRGPLISPPRCRELRPSPTYLFLIVVEFVHATPYTQRNLFKILLNQPEIRLYIPFFD